MGEIKKVFKQFYPHFLWNGSLEPKKLVKNDSPYVKDDGLIGLLFSGGLDCVSSSLAMIGKKQLLITNQGVDMSLKNHLLWQNVQQQCREFAQTYGHQNAFISCNFCAILNYAYLKTLAPGVTKWWWLDYVVDALNHTGVAAPLLYLQGCSKLYMAASHTIDHPFPYGSHPLIDNKIAFAGITVHHDQEELDRCDKIDLVAAASTLFQEPLPFLRVCWTDQEGNNCLSCEKCLRTLNNCIVTGHDPQEFGFAITIDEAMERTRAFLVTDPINSAKLFWEWRVIQHRAAQRLINEEFRSNDEKEYLLWLQAIKLDGQYASKIHIDDATKPYFTWLWLKR